MAATGGEENELRTAAMRNAQNIFQLRSRAEEELRRNSDWMRVTLESIGDAVISTDVDGRITFMNAVAQSLTGWTMVEALGKPLPEVFTIVNETTRQTVENPAIRALQQGITVGLANHTILIAKNGREWPIDDSAAPIRNDDGAIIGAVLVFREVTERHRADAALRHSEHHFRMMADSAPVLIWVSDADKRHTWFNKPWLDFVGREHETQVGNGWAESIHPDDRGRYRQTYEQAFDARRPFSIEYRLSRHDGEYRWLLVNGAPRHEVDGSFAGYVGSCVDITDRRQAEEALRETQAASARQQRLYEAILGNTPDLAYVFDLQHRFIYANEGLLKMWGRSWNDSIGKTCLEIGYERWHAEMHGREIDEVAATKRPIRGEVPFNGTAGRRIYDYIMVPVLNAAGEVEAVAGTTRDVTDLKQDEMAAAKLAAIIESSDDAIISKQLDGVITSWNRGAERIFGYASSEAVGQDIYLIIPEERHDEERHVLARLQKGEKIDHFETERRTKNGDRINISLTVSPVRDRSGQIVGASKIARDITERKRAEAEREELLASERSARADAERAGKLKEEFLATLSHELRTPLNAMLGWITILRKKPPTAETLEQGLSVIDRNARMQAQLIADLLDMSRIVSGKMRMDVQRVELPVVIEAALESVRSAADARQVRIQSVLEPISEPVHGDPTRLQQVVWNLLSNAVKFTPRGGRVQVVLARVNSHVEIMVSDTGKGIKPEFLPHVFERFRQADSSAARDHGGLGLGLAIVKQLVELHGGTVHVESQGEGCGATFTVHLPLAVMHAHPIDRPRAHPTAASLTAVHYEPPNLAGVRVLVVDDEFDARDLMKRVLAECNADVVLAGSTEEAIAAVESTKPDVIISDIGMPKRDGYELMKILRRNGIRTPAAALTAFARPEDRTRALSAGYQTHIAKPVEPAELLAAVAALAHKTAETRHET